jgi:hypothetical protein
MIPTLPPLPSVSITPASIWVLFAVVAILWVVMTGILNYHWKTYGIGAHKAAFMKFIYLVGSSFFLIIIFLSALTFSLQ